MDQTDATKCKHDSDHPYEALMLLLTEHVRVFRAQYYLNDDAREVSKDALRALLLAEGGACALKDDSSKAPDHLKLFARRAVEERVVQEMMRDPGSHLWYLNFIWVAQRVCRHYGIGYGLPIDPHGSLDEAIQAVFHATPVHLQGQFLHYTNEICRRIFQGLHGYRFESNFDTWRLQIIKHTLSTLHSREERASRHETTFSRMGWLAQDASESAKNAYTPVSPGLTPEEQADKDEMVQILNDFIDLTAEERPATANMIKLLVEGTPPREVASLLGVEPQVVHQAFFRWKRRMRTLYHSYDPLYGDVSAHTLKKGDRRNKKPMKPRTSSTKRAQDKQNSL